MQYTVFVYITLAIGQIAFLLAELYFIIMATDLESDYVNPVEFCQKMGLAIPIEMGAQAFVALWLLLSGELISFVIVAPVFFYNVFAFTQKRHLFDATTIFRRIRDVKIEHFVKLGVYFVYFCYFLYSMIWSLIQVDTI